MFLSASYIYSWLSLFIIRLWSFPRFCFRYIRNFTYYQNSGQTDREIYVEGESRIERKRHSFLPNVILNQSLTPMRMWGRSRPRRGVFLQLTGIYRQKRFYNFVSGSHSFFDMITSTIKFSKLKIYKLCMFQKCNWTNTEHLYCNYLLYIYRILLSIREVKP